MSARNKEDIEEMAWKSHFSCEQSQRIGRTGTVFDPADTLRKLHVFV